MKKKVLTRSKSNTRGKGTKHTRLATISHLHRNYPIRLYGNDRKKRITASGQRSRTRALRQHPKPIYAQLHNTHPASQPARETQSLFCGRCSTAGKTRARALQHWTHTHTCALACNRIGRQLSNSVIPSRKVDKQPLVLFVRGRAREPPRRSLTNPDYPRRVSCPIGTTICCCCSCCCWRGRKGVRMERESERDAKRVGVGD